MPETIALFDTVFDSLQRLTAYGVPELIRYVMPDNRRKEEMSAKKPCGSSLCVCYPHTGQKKYPAPVFAQLPLGASL